ncbi:DNA-3-methyladenine glycosylase [Carboxylicivirga sediminis]|uniref:Putative 3-methyladenine DNA glycosylase n=1 Tax=Carboxylicivirga sediminis TaxID=2006564 RepID=A0A941F432_9BACT|nr:DNA-3-methyladenine glycosylase [Carboxylicivirga sediminis]MBR8535594.1 DNA-3-methyladenine glycosylase [Carboxylicivirga sediminis]
MRLDVDFFRQDVLVVASSLLGKVLVRRFNDGREERFVIVETEAYRGEEDGACHASKGRTSRTEVMYHEGGVVYVYLIYGMYWMLNIVTGQNDEPQAVLIRAVKNIDGPGRVGKVLHLDKSFYGESIVISSRLWIEDSKEIVAGTVRRTERIGIDYAPEEWRNKKWRFEWLMP